LPTNWQWLLKAVGFPGFPASEKPGFLLHKYIKQDYKMDYLTNYYKNLSEQLQNKIYNLNNKKKMLIKEDGGPVLDYLDHDKVTTMLLRFRWRLEDLYGIEKATELFRQYWDDWQRVADQNQKYPGVFRHTLAPQFFTRPGRNWGGPVDVPPPPPPPPSPPKE